AQADRVIADTHGGGIDQYIIEFPSQFRKPQARAIRTQQSLGLFSPGSSANQPEIWDREWTGKSSNRIQMYQRIGHPIVVVAAKMLMQTGIPQIGVDQAHRTSNTAG